MWIKYYNLFSELKYMISCIPVDWHNLQKTIMKSCKFCNSTFYKHFTSFVTKDVMVVSEKSVLNKLVC